MSDYKPRAGVGARTRGGRRATNIRRIDDSIYPFEGDIDGRTLSWTETGNYWFGTEGGAFDLVADWEEPVSPDADGWIVHTPGPCPVPPETMVEIRFRDGETYGPEGAYDWRWNEDGSGAITHYRIVSPAPSAGPVRMVTRPEIVPGVYGRLRVWEPTTDNDNDPVARITFASKVGGHSMGASPAMLTARELRAASDTLSQLADAMEQESKL